MPLFKDISQFTPTPNYRVHVEWGFLETQLLHWSDRTGGMGGLDLDPDFQRAHVWNEDQQVKYVEFILQGGQSGRQILWNAKGWMRKFEGTMTLVDGKQRLEAARRFMRNEIPAFGHLIKEYSDNIRMVRPHFEFLVNDLPTRKQVLQWYLELNTGGTPHTSEEIARVSSLLNDELKKI